MLVDQWSGGSGRRVNAAGAIPDFKLTHYRIAGILQDLPNYIRVKKGDVDLAVLFFAFRGGAEGKLRDTMNDLAKVAAERNLSLECATLAT